MNKLAIFVEGQTEQIFIQRLLEEIAGRKCIAIECQKLRGGKKVPKNFVVVKAAAQTSDTRWYILIVDCANDNRVTSEIREQYKSLVNSGYVSIVGLRDVYPTPSTDIPKLRKGAMHRMPTTPVLPNIVFAIMEIEAWFLAEHTHFARLDPSLNCTEISCLLGFDPSTCNVEEIPHPTQDLNRIYQSIGRSYTKRRNCVEEVVNLLDYDVLYLERANRVASLKSLIEAFDGFFALERTGTQAV